MNGRVLVVVGGLGIGIAVYAVLSLGGRTNDEESARPAPATADPGRTNAARRTPRPIRSGSGDDDARPIRAPRINPTVQPANAATRERPKPPELSLDEAREQFDDLMLELDREIRRGEEVGKPLSNEAWVEYYRRGSEAVTPIVQLLPSDDPNRQTEINERQTDLRERLDALQPATQTP